MVVCRNIGRLGNNMFQIAAALGYAKKFGYQWAADTGNGVSDPYSSIHQTFPNLPKENFGGGNRYHEHPNKQCEIHQTHFNDCHFDYHPIPNLGPNVSLTGFFQSYKYFEGQDEEIKKLFALPHVEGYEDYVSIHVRRGDYVQHAGSFPPIDEHYIWEAIRRFTLNEGSPKFENIKAMKFIFFSDDIRWCKDFVSKGFWFDEKMEGRDYIKISSPDLHIQFSEGRNEREDLSLMASCGHHIIANSTFSWWGSFLGHNPDRIIISPSCKRGSWFGMDAGVKRDVVDLLPPNWVQIEKVLVGGRFIRYV